MFDLEESILQWRKQMLAAGINAPMPLDELESHLRDEIDQQIKIGFGEADAFKKAIQEFGQANLLTSEFKKAGGFFWWMGENRRARINRIIGLVWVVYCGESFFHTGRALFGFFSSSDHGFNAALLFAPVLAAIYLRGLIGSVLFVCGIARERRIVRGIATLDAVGGVIALTIRPIAPLVLAFTLLGIISIWLLRPPQQPTLATI
jgi:hypothetical protein